MTSANITNPSRPIVAADGGRLLIYGISFAGLMVALFGLVGLIGLFLAETAFSSRNLVSASNAREQISYYLAALIVATPVWLGFWQIAQRRVARAAYERDSIERRLFFGLVFGITAAVSLFASHTVLRVLLSLFGPYDVNNTLQDGISSLIRLIVYGGAGYLFTRMAWRERSNADQDPPRDLALQAIAGLALAFLSIGIINAVGAILAELIAGNRHILLGSTPDSAITLWAEIAAWILSGGVVWAAVTYWESACHGVREFRVEYLYLVLATSALLTLGFGGDLLYELLRRAFGYRPDPMWNVLYDTVPVFLTAGALWAYHWTVLTKQTALDPSRSAGSTIVWPRRPYLAALSFIGLAASAAGAVTLIWTLMDFIFKRQSLTGDSWWRDTASTGIALLAIGALPWLRSWSTLQAAAAASARERGAEARRRLVGAIVLVAALAGLGFGIAGLWLVLRMVLGGPHDASTMSDMFRFLSTALVVGGIAVYHALIFREDLRADAGRANRIRIAALVVPGKQDLVAALSRSIGRPIEVVGYLATDEPSREFDLRAVEEQLSVLAKARVPRVLLVVHGDRAEILPFSKNLRAAMQAAEPGVDLHPAPSST
ncbi:MAG: hypothetical protein PVSMB7_28800 [Chloroflexota bacterium]